MIFHWELASYFTNPLEIQTLVGIPICKQLLYKTKCHVTWLDEQNPLAYNNLHLEGPRNPRPHFVPCPAPTKAGGTWRERFALRILF